MRPLQETRRSSASPSVVLPEPDSPTTPTRLAGAQLEGEAVDGLHVVDGAAQQPALDREPDPQVLGLQHDRRVGRRSAAGRPSARPT